MGRLVGSLGTLFALVCMATLLTEAAIFTYAWSKGLIDKDKLARVAAIVQGTESIATSTPVDHTKHGKVPTSFEELDQLRTTRMRHLELREQAIHNALDQISVERDKLLKEKKSFELLVADYRKQVDESDRGRVSKGQEDVRLIWENIKPKLAKELILKMIDADEKTEVVKILSSMQIAKQSKIVSEFKTPEDQKKLDDIMRLIRLGPAEVPPPDALTPAAPTGSTP